MSRTQKACTFAILAFALALLLSHKLYVGVVAGVVVAIGTYLTWWPRTVPKSEAYAVSGGMFAMIGIAVITQGDWLPGILMFVVAGGCALRANDEWKREHP